MYVDHVYGEEEESHSPTLLVVLHRNALCALTAKRPSRGQTDSSTMTSTSRCIWRASSNQPFSLSAQQIKYPRVHN